MSVELYRNISTVSFILAGIMIFISIVLFFRLNISKVIGDITGKTARKAIKDIHDQNTRSSGDKSYKSRPENIKKGKPTDKGSSLQSPARQNSQISAGAGIGKVNSQKSQDETAVLFNDENFTTVLYNDSCENSFSGITGPLGGMTNINTPGEGINQQFELILDITYLHTNEIIL